MPHMNSTHSCCPYNDIACVVLCSQFFLCTVQTSWLDGKHVVFGNVTKGLEASHIVFWLESSASHAGPAGLPAWS